MMTAEQLKNSILQLALQGKLVPQNSNDKRASDLLKEDQRNKTINGRRSDVKQKKVSKISKNSDGEYVDNEGIKKKSLQGRIPFEIPDSWEWIHLGYVCDIARGGSPRPIKSYLTERDDGINWIKIGDSDIGGKYINSTKEKIIPEGMKKSRFVHAGDFLLTNSMSFGRPYILNCDGCIHDGWLVLTGYKEVYDKEFLYYMLSSGYAFNQFGDVVSGAVVKNLNSDKVADTIFPVPPLEEQKRIVAKIEELMPFVEQYAVVSTKLNTLNTTFPDLMKKSILQEAVQGKLVPQDPNDEPASVLLKKIAEEKNRLIKEGKIKKQKPLPEITEDEIPFDIPESWEWARWGTISENIQYGYNAPAKETGRIKMVRISDIQNNRVIWDTVPYCDIPEKSIVDYLLKENDILFARTGGTVGKSFLVKEVREEAIYAGYLIRTRYSQKLCPEYLKYFMESDLYWRQLKNGTIATAQPNCNGKTLSRMVIPIPPLNEQIRIVDELNKVLKYSEQLRW